jgi:Ca2+-binding RTX toxin-like protein
MRIGPLLAVLPLAASMMIPTAQAAQAVTVPPECDTGFDLTGFNIIIGTDTVIGGPGDDFLAGGQNSDLVNGGPGDDFLDGDLPPGDDGQPTLDPRPNTDRCIGAQGVDVALLCEVALAVEG